MINLLGLNLESLHVLLEPCIRFCHVYDKIYFQMCAEKSNSMMVNSWFGATSTLTQALHNGDNVEFTGVWSSQLQQVRPKRSSFEEVVMLM